MAAAYIELGELINEISAYNSLWETRARDMRAEICEVQYPSSEAPQAIYKNPKYSWPAIDKFQEDLDDYKRSGPDGAASMS